MRPTRQLSVGLLVLACLGLDACTDLPLAPLAPPPPDLSEAEIARRLAFIEERLEGSRRDGSLWNRGWYVADGAGIAIGVASAVVASDGPSRASGVLTAALSLGGIAYQRWMPMRIRHGADPLRALPAATRPERLRRLERAQELLVADARRARVQIDWRAHAINTVLAVGSAGIVAASGSRKSPIWIQGAVALIGGEAQLWTEPSQPRQDLEDYRRRFGAGGPRVVSGWQLVPAHRGLALRFRF